MTEQTFPSPTDSTITMAFGSDIAGALETLSLSPAARESITLLPSSLRRDDRLVSALRHYLRDTGVPSRALLSPNPVAEIARFSSSSNWTTVQVSPPDTPVRSVRLHSQLLEGHPIWTVTDVDAVHGRGPFVLDLLARYANPISRLRHLTATDRADVAVDLNLAVTISRCVVSKRLAGGVIVAITTDRIAAELLALSLADEHLDTRHETTGPWEDRVVQRATELELGVLIPQQLRINLAGQVDPALLADIARVAARIGTMVRDTIDDSP